MCVDKTQVNIFVRDKGKIVVALSMCVWKGLTQGILIFLKFIGKLTRGIY
jgi:hypothetical protein